jgi:adenylate kinase family enzyme
VSELNAAGITDPQLRASYSECKRLNSLHGKTYYLATLLLPASKRPFVHALYGFARYADEIVDDLASTLTAQEKAEVLRAFLAEAKTPLQAALELSIASDEIIKRLSSRRTCRGCGASNEAGATNCSSCNGSDLYQREDDKEEVIARRLEVYEEQTAPIISFYRSEGLLITIPAVGTVAEITEHAITALGRLS